MGEAIVNARYQPQWTANSAGTYPSGYVHPLAIQVLEEIGINHQGRSKSVEEIRGVQFDLVITVCDSAAEECPLWLGSGNRLHHSFPDPAKATGSYEEILNVFRQVRDDMTQFLAELLAKPIA
jgi:arsenate reductase